MVVILQNVCLEVLVCKKEGLVELCDHKATSLLQKR